MKLFYLLLICLISCGEVSDLYQLSCPYEGNKSCGPECIPVGAICCDSDNGNYCPSYSHCCENNKECCDNDQ